MPAAPRYPGPLWAKPDEPDDRRLPFGGAMVLGALTTLAIGWAIGQLDLRHHERERTPMQVTLAPPPPPPLPPVQQIQRVEPRPEPAPPEKKPPPEVRKVERKPLPQPKAPVATPQETLKEPPRAEASPVPMEAPAPSPAPSAAPSIPSEVGAAAPPKPAAAPAPTRPAGEIVRGLVPVYKVEPKYPRRAQQAGIAGSFTCHLFINPDGSVRDVKIIRGENQDLFAREIRAALMQWRFKPEGVDLIGEIDINFRLE
jgi:protein TonB